MMTTRIRPGDTFGQLTIVGMSPEKRNGMVCWVCRCQCGNLTVVRAQDLRRGRQISCGCAKRQRTVERNHKHGGANTRPYRIWKNMKTRCYNPKTDEFKNYGGRGIKMCDRWAESFENFWEDMSAGYSDDLTIDRIDNDGDYQPENCRWATKKTQARNTRVNVITQTPMGELVLAELSEVTGLPYHTLKSRARKGLSGAKLIAPIDTRFGRRATNDTGTR